MNLKKDNYAVFGRVSDCENILIFIEAISVSDASAQFLELVKVEQDWDGESDIYIDFCVSLSEIELNKVLTEEKGSGTNAFSFSL